MFSCSVSIVYRLLMEDYGQFRRPTERTGDRISRVNHGGVCSAVNIAAVTNSVTEINNSSFFA